MFKGIDCDIFNNPNPMTMALSVLVVIEMLNATSSQYIFPLNKIGHQKFCTVKSRRLENNGGTDCWKNMKSRIHYVVQGYQK
jgi:hypothetical protein